MLRNIRQKSPCSIVNSCRNRWFSSTNQRTVLALPSTSRQGSNVKRSFERTKLASYSLSFSPSWTHKSRHFGTSSATRLSAAPGEPLEPPPVTFSPEQLLKALEMTSEVQLPPIPPSEDKEVFWRAYLLANQIILFLGARPPAEAEAFSSVFQVGKVEPGSDIARARVAFVKMAEKIVDTMGFLPEESSLRKDYPEVLQRFEKIEFLVGEQKVSTGEETELERWSRFYAGMRAELVEFTVQLTSFIEKEVQEENSRQ